MSNDVLLKINGVPVFWDGKTIEYTGEMSCCSDGSPRSYGPEPPYGIDYLANAGSPGNWWGISCDSDGVPYIQQEGDPRKWPYPGYYVSTTAYYHSQYPPDDCRRFVNAEKVPFSVIPSSVRMAVEPKFLGCRAEITDLETGKVLECVTAEIGPSNHLGEASIAACEYFGIDSSPKSGGSSDTKRWLYRFWPGVPFERWELI